MPSVFSHGTLGVSILTGALGSGKTTLLNRLVSDPALKGAMVLINEFGDIGLDHEIVGAISEDVVLLAGKGHEDYQEICGVRQPFSDLDEARKALAAWEKHDA